MFTILRTPRLELREFTEADLPALHRILQEPGIFQYFPNPCAPSLERVQRMIQEQVEQYRQWGFGEWAVEQKDKPGLLGWCGLNYLPETDEYEVAYLLSRNAWGNGYATEAATASLNYGFSEVGLSRIIALVHPENLASRRVAEKIGMTFLDMEFYWGMECVKYIKRCED